MKSKSLAFPVNVELYNSGILFSLGQTDEELKNELLTYEGLDKEQIEKLLKRASMEKAAGMCLKVKKGNWCRLLVRIKEYPDLPEVHGSIAHEIFHAVHFILHGAGLILTFQSDEAFAYMVSFLTDKVYHEVYKYNCAWDKKQARTRSRKAVKR